jgi:hypothetical protein
MDDIKVLLYIVFGVIYVISRAMKNRKKQQKQQDTEQGESNQGPEKELSFEDLLKEFTQEKTAEPTVSYDEPKYEPEVFEKPTNEEVAWAGSDDEATSVYEQSIKEAENLQDEDMMDKGHNHHLQRFDVFEEEEEDTFLTDLAAELQEEDGLKKAVIYKEILDRKHF